jgi:hypothetical protein
MHYGFGLGPEPGQGLPRPVKTVMHYVFWVESPTRSKFTPFGQNRNALRSPPEASRPKSHRPEGHHCSQNPFIFRVEAALAAA